MIFYGFHFFVWKGAGSPIYLSVDPLLEDTVALYTSVGQHLVHYGKDKNKVAQHLYDPFKIQAKYWHNSNISAHGDGGPRSPSAHAWLFACPPISMSEILLANVSAESPSNISPNPS